MNTWSDESRDVVHDQFGGLKWRITFFLLYFPDPPFIISFTSSRPSSKNRKVKELWWEESLVSCQIFSFSIPLPLFPHLLFNFERYVIVIVRYLRDRNPSLQVPLSWWRNLDVVRLDFTINKIVLQNLIIVHLCTIETTVETQRLTQGTYVERVCLRHRRTSVDHPTGRGEWLWPSRIRCTSVDGLQTRDSWFYTWRTPSSWNLFIYYESTKRKLKTKYICGCRCYERLQTKTKEFTCLEIDRLDQQGLFIMNRWSES